MANTQPARKTLADRLREFLDALDRALKPMPPAPQPVPVRDVKPHTRR